MPSFRSTVLSAALLLLSTGAARADVPDKGEGTIALLGGLRLIPQHGFLSSAQQNGYSISQKQFQPQGTVFFGFKADEDLHATIGLGYGIDRYKISPGGDLSVTSVTILLGADTPLFKGERWEIYGGGGLGYSLNTFSRGGASDDGNSTVGYLAVGLRRQLGGRFALMIEDRYTVASTSYPTLSSNSINVGGNLLSAGLLLHFLSPEDKGHPHAPGE